MGTLTTLKPVSEIIDPEVRAYAADANELLASKSWCSSVSSLDLGCSIAGIFGVFLAQIEPADPKVDKKLWVVVGDLPPAYLVCDDASNWQEALAAYIWEMRQWVEAVEHGQPVGHLMPVNAPPTPDYANQLSSRLDFLQARFVNVDIESIDGDA